MLQSATTFITIKCYNNNSNISNNINIISNIMDSNNFAISQSPNTNIILQRPATLYNSNVSQQATFTLTGLNPFPTGRTTSPAYFTLTSAPNQSATTISPPIGVSNNRSFGHHQPIIIGAPNSLFLPNIATNLARPQIINIADQPSFIPRPAVILNQDPVTPSTSHINRINVPNAFQNQNNLRPQLVWDFSPSSTTNQQQLRRPKQRNSLNINQANR